MLTGEIRSRIDAIWNDYIVNLRGFKHLPPDGSGDDAELPFRVADDLLRATALALIAHAWARAEAVSARPAHAGDAFHAAKRESAAHCFTHLRPEFEHALAQARAGWSPFAQVALGEMA